MTLDKLAQMMQDEFSSIRGDLGGLNENLGNLNNKIDSVASELREFKTDTKSSIRALSGDVAKIKVIMEDQEHEKRIHILQLEQRHQDGRLRKVENSVGLVK